MASPPIKEAVVVVVDVGQGMGGLGGGVHERMRSCVAEQFWRKMMFVTQDEIGVLLAGTAETKNSLNAQHPSEYKHMSVLRNIARPTVEDLEKLCAIPIGGKRMDIVEALILAADMLHSRVQKYRFKKRVFLYTAAADECERKADLDSVVSAYARQDIRLDVIGVDFSFTTKEAADEHDDWDILTMKQQNEKVSYHIVDTLRSHREVINASNRSFHYHLCNGSSLMLLEDAVSTLMTEASKKVRLTTLANCCFDLGDATNGLRIPIKLYNKTSLARPQTLPMSSKRARLSGEATDSYQVEIERRYFRADDPEQEVEKEGMVKAYRYGNSAVPFNEIDEKMLEFDGGPKAVTVLAFVPRASVKRHHMRSNVVIASTPPEDPDATNAFLPLIQAMYETDMCVLLRVVRRDNKAPTICLGWPHITSRKRCLLLTELPFCEDLRKYDFAPFSDTTLPRKEHLDAAEALINAMDLTDTRRIGGKSKRNDAGASRASPEGEHPEAEEDPEEGVQHRYVFNPALQYMVQCIRERVLKPGVELPPPEERILRSSLDFHCETNQLYPFLAGAMREVEGLERACGTRVNQAAQKAKDQAEKKSYWFAGSPAAAASAAGGAQAHPAPPPHLGGEASTAGLGGASFLTEQQSRAGTTQQGTPRRSGGGGGGAASIGLQGGDGSLGRDFLSLAQEASRQAVGHVTTISPVEDFNAMVGRRDGDFLQRAFEGIKRVTTQLVQDSVGQQFFEKALSCIVALRSACCREDEPAVFNDFLRETKLSTGYGKKSDFWKKVQAAGITLISSAESPASAVKPEEAVLFPRLDIGVPAPVQPVAGDLDRDDDLFGGLS